MVNAATEHQMIPVELLPLPVVFIKEDRSTCEFHGTSVFGVPNKKKVLDKMLSPKLGITVHAIDTCLSFPKVEDYSNC